MVYDSTVMSQDFRQNLARAPIHSGHQINLSSIALGVHRSGPALTVPLNNNSQMSGLVSIQHHPSTSVNGTIHSLVTCPKPGCYQQMTLEIPLAHISKALQAVCPKCSFNIRKRFAIDHSGKAYEVPDHCSNNIAVINAPPGAGISATSFYGNDSQTAYQSPFGGTITSSYESKRFKSTYNMMSSNASHRSTTDFTNLPRQAQTSPAVMSTNMGMFHGMSKAGSVIQLPHSIRIAPLSAASAASIASSSSKSSVTPSRPGRPHGQRSRKNKVAKKPTEVDLITLSDDESDDDDCEQSIEPSVSVNGDAGIATENDDPPSTTEPSTSTPVNTSLCTIVSCKNPRDPFGAIDLSRFHIKCRSIRIGDFRFKCSSLYISDSTLSFVVSQEQLWLRSYLPKLEQFRGPLRTLLTDEREHAILDIQSDQITNIQHYLVRSTHVSMFLFLSVSEECVLSMRHLLSMPSSCPVDMSVAWFDGSNAKASYHQHITVVFEPIESSGELDLVCEEVNRFAKSMKIQSHALTYQSSSSLLNESVPPIMKSMNQMIGSTKSTAGDLSKSTAPGDNDFVTFRSSTQANVVGSVTKTASNPTSQKKSAKNSSYLFKHPFPLLKTDVNCLIEGEYLNDSIIEFYLTYLVTNLTNELKGKVHLFNTFFYRNLTEQKLGVPVEKFKTKTEKMKALYKQVKKWTKNVDIFSKDFIIIPINECSHWFLAIICYPGTCKNACLSDSSVPSTPTTATTTGQQPDAATNCSNGSMASDVTDSSASTDTVNFDSDDMAEIENEVKQMQEDIFTLDTEVGLVDGPLSTVAPVTITRKDPCIIVFDSLLTGASHWKTVNVLRNYLTCEWESQNGTVRTFDKSTIPGSYPKVPQQDNEYDCGVYLLQFAEEFLMNPLKEIRSPMKGLSKWFGREIVHRKRIELKSLISDLSKQFEG